MKTVRKIANIESVAMTGDRFADCYPTLEKLWLSGAIGIILLGCVNPLRAGENVSDKDPPVKASPAFEVADKNSDHFVTKQELRDYPLLLEYFDRVDAGKDGKLEQLEYDNLIMEKKREGEYR